MVKFSRVADTASSMHFVRVLFRVWLSHLSRGHQVLCQHGAFSGVGAVVASFMPTECPQGGGGIFGKSLKRAICNTLGLHAVLTTCLGFLSLLDDGCVACCLLLSCSYHVCIQIHATCCCFHPCITENFGAQRARSGGASWVKVTREPARQAKSLAPVRSNLHVPTWNTRF